MTPGPPFERSAEGSQLVAWAGLAAVAAAFALDFALDVRQRDLFSWMDPYQYYDFARGVLEGRERFDAFEVPSIFPFLVVPFLAVRPGVPSALLVNLAALPLLLWSLHGLCRELGLRTPSPWVAILVLSSPLLLGLSRTLYVEFTLTAVAAAALRAWLVLLRDPRPRNAVACGVWVAVGALTKTTFSVFLAAPLAGAFWLALTRRRDREAAVLVLATLVPQAAAVALHAGVFTPSFGYYLSLANTAIPTMRLIGPPDVFSFASLLYYPALLGRGLLALLVPGLLLAAAFALRDRALDPRRLALWLWLLGPLLLFTLQPVKEPRHVAPCVVPAVLLCVIGLERLSRRMGVAPLAVAVGLALAQYAAVTLHTVEVPYFLDRPLRHAEIREAMLRTLDAGASADAPDARELHWRYDQNVALSGFPPNEALALVWQGFPGVVFDLDTYEDAGRDAGGGPAGFEDLYFLAAVDAYNRRCGWHRYQRPLPRDEVEANADFVLLYEEGEGDGAGPADGRFPHHARVATLERPPGRIHVLRSARRTVPYRTLHARRFLARGETRREERRVVARELLMAATLAGDRAAARELIDEFPELRAPGDVRNIYWIGGYLALQRLAERRLAEWGL